MFLNDAFSSALHWSVWYFSVQGAYLSVSAPFVKFQPAAPTKSVPNIIASVLSWKESSPLTA